MCWQSNFRGNEPVNVEPPLVGEGCFEGLVSESRLLDEHDTSQRLPNRFREGFRSNLPFFALFSPEKDC